MTAQGKRRTEKDFMDLWKIFLDRTTEKFVEANKQTTNAIGSLEQSHDIPQNTLRATWISRNTSSKSGQKDLIRQFRILSTKGTVSYFQTMTMCI